mmetsp:Transcript_72846/g.171319  ORF Transcript_72846/g.171319 Transcript_72846/m.171319 type:complete len:236 (+) Transcript_72846:106-813(+)
MRLSVKEQEIHELQSLLQDLRQCLQPRLVQTRVSLLDPGVCHEFKRMRTEVSETKAALKRTQEDLEAQHYNPNSNVGRQIIAKLRQLTKENQDFAALMSESHAQKLESVAALERMKVKEYRKALNEMNEMILQAEEEADALRSGFRNPTAAEDTGEEPPEQDGVGQDAQMDQEGEQGDAPAGEEQWSQAGNENQGDVSMGEAEDKPDEPPCEPEAVAQQDAQPEAQPEAQTSEER